MTNIQNLLKEQEKKIVQELRKQSAGWGWNVSSIR